MRSTKQYGLVNSWQEHQMLVKAEHTFEKRQGKDKHESTRRNQDTINAN